MSVSTECVGVCVSMYVSAGLQGHAGAGGWGSSGGVAAAAAQPSVSGYADLEQEPI